MRSSDCGAKEISYATFIDLIARTIDISLQARHCMFLSPVTCVTNAVWPHARIMRFRAVPTAVSFRDEDVSLHACHQLISERV